MANSIKVLVLLVDQCYDTRTRAKVYPNLETSWTDGKIRLVIELSGEEPLLTFVAQLHGIVLKIPGWFRCLKPTSIVKIPVSMILVDTRVKEAIRYLNRKTLVLLVIISNNNAHFRQILSSDQLLVRSIRSIMYFWIAFIFHLCFLKETWETFGSKPKFAIITCDEVDNHDEDGNVLAIDDIKNYQFNNPPSRDFKKTYDRLLHFKVKDKLRNELPIKEMLTLTTSVGLPISIVLASTGLLLGLSSGVIQKTQKNFWVQS